ncbi:MAG: phage tail tape measure protein [Comamonas sp.]|jgi:lambda family phage tail tape measure protein|uniref:phage tail tape measure protein n=1 Tax=Comamonas sp. TaxID=34028 RepID=UPI0028170AA9|nr:phage tail tape measure protein [Comamonas sp.]MDR0215614.1 phage tail tape measure protein [Comamonas sp.]
MSNDMVAQIAMTADASGVEAGVGRAKRSLADLGQAARSVGDQMQQGGRTGAEGIEEVGRGGDRSAKKLEQATRSMQQSLQRQIAELEAGGKSSRQYVESLAKLRGVDVSALTPLLDQLEQVRKRTDDAKKASESFAGGAKTRAEALRQEQVALAASEKSIGGYEAAFLSLKQTVVAAAAGLTVMGLIDTADNWGQVAIRVEQATQSQADYNLVMERTAQSAKETFRDVTEVRELFIRTGGSIQELGYSLSQTLDLTDSFSLLLVTNAASADRGAAAIDAYSKAIQTGSINSDGWKAIIGAMPTVVDRLAESTGKTAAEIKRLGIEGKLSLLDFNKTLIGTVDATREAALAMPTMVQDALRNFKTSFAEIVGYQNKATGATAALVTGMNLLGNNLEVVATAAGGLALVMGSRVAVSAAIATGSFVAQQVAVIRLGVAISGTSVASVAGLTAMAAASRAAAASLAFLTGPWGATLLLAGTAAAAFYGFRNSVVDLRQSIGDLNQPLDQLQEKLDKLPEEKRISIILEVKDQAADKARQAQDAYEALGTAVLGTLTNFGTSGAEIQQFYERLETARSTGDSLVPILRDAAKAANLGSEIPRNWLTLAGNLREVQAAAEGLRNTADGLSTAGPAAGSADPAKLLAKQALAAAQASLAGTQGYKSLAEQMGDVRKQGDGVRAALKGLVESGQGASEEANQLRSRLVGLDEALVRIGKRDAGGGLKSLRDSLAIDLQAYQKQLEGVSFAYAQAQKVMEARRSAGGLDDSDYFESRRAFINLEADAQERLLQKELERYKQEKVTKDNRLQIVKGIEETEAKLQKSRVERGTALQVLDIQQEAAIRNQAAALESARQAAQDYLDTLQRGFDRDVSAVGWGSARRSEEAGRQQIEDRYANQRRELANQRAQAEIQAGGALTEQVRKQYADRLAIINEFEAKALTSYRVGVEQRKAAEGDWVIGARRAFDEYQASAANVAQMSADIFTSAFRGMEDAVVSFAMTGKADFKSLANSVIADLIRIQIRASLVQAMGGAGESGGLFGTLFSGAMSYFGGGSTGASSASSAYSNGASFKFNALGGVYESPSLSQYRNQIHDSPKLFAFAKGAGVFGEAGPEAIMPLTRAADGNLGVRALGASAGGAGNIKVELINSGRPMQVERTEASRGPDGQVLLKAFLKEAVDGAVAEVSNQAAGGYGKFNQALLQRERMGR